MRQAQAQAKQMVSQEAIYQEARKRADELVVAAQGRIRELKQVTNTYVDDALYRTEEAIKEALADIRDSRARLNKLVTPRQERAESPMMEDI